MEDKRKIYYRENGVLKTKEVAVTPEGSLCDNLRRITNWQARALYIVLTSDQTQLPELIPNMIDPSTIPNSRYMSDPSYGPGYKGAIQRILRRYNPKTPVLTEHLEKLAEEDTLREYLLHLVKATVPVDPDSARQIKGADIRSYDREQLMYQLGKFETIYFPHAANKYLEKHGKVGRKGNK
jgi:hypothetical protein